MIGFLLGLLIVGLIAGFIARLLVPGRQNLSIPATILVGIVGSFVGGFLGNLLFGTGEPGFFNIWTWVLAVGGSIIVLLIYGLITRKRA